MGIWDRIRGELIDIIEWLDDSNDTMVYRFERRNNEIKYGAKLTVREGQAAVFINEGQIADIFQPGMYTLETKNLPILATLKGWKYGFESPFKAEVYFVSTRRFTDLKWGTKNPIMMRDQEFGPIRLRAFGTYTVRVKDPGVFIQEIVGTDGHFTKDEVTDQLRNIVVSRFADLLGESKIPALDLAGNYDELGKFITERISPNFEGYGLELSELYVENVSLPEAVEQALDKRSSMNIVGNMQEYTQFQAAEAIEDAANNPSGGGGLAAGGLGAGMGIAMGQQMGQMMSQPPQQPGAAPPPIPQSPSYFVAVNGQQTGPFNLDLLRQQAQSGQLTRESLVWTQGMAQWQPAGQVGSLMPLFGAAPPPLPPQ